MKIFDMHIHALNTKPNPEYLIRKLDDAGVYGACVFSNWPKRANAALGTSFEERLEEVLNWTNGYEERLFPVLWIHPYEDNVIENIHKAVEKGVVAFKIICTDFYVYEEECLAVLKEIAALNKPVIFHTGILWDGQVSSNYNRPINWESLLTIKGLRFSMGHCSWPWIDECIALYGKFLNALRYNGNNNAEMFFDITPGTPEIYREELLTKLFTIGYDVSNNVMFGTDASAHEYSDTWAKNWINIDRKIMDNLGVSKENREKLYYENLLRFLGKINKEISIATPTTDNSNAWDCKSKNATEIIEKWYKKLNFPKYFDDEFYNALSTIPVSDAITIENYDLNCKDGKRNLLSYLFMCEDLAKKYEEKGIDETVLLDTLSDLVIWTKTWSEIKGELYLGEIEWLSRHLSMQLFKLGRLQFCFGKAEHDHSGTNVKKGDNIIEIHIPATSSLDVDDCKKSIDNSKEFFAKYYPEFAYDSYTCHSWLLDTSLIEILKPDSNIISFQNLFKIIQKEESYSILCYVFKRNTTLLNLNNLKPYNSFSEKVIERIKNGGKFFVSYGFLNK